MMAVSDALDGSELARADIDENSPSVLLHPALMIFDVAIKYSYLILLVSVTGTASAPRRR